MQLDKADLAAYINDQCAARGKGFKQSYTEMIVDIIQDYLNKRVTAKDDDVEEIYKIYPRKASPKKAKVAIKKACTEKGIDYILDKVQTYAGCVKTWTDEEREFIPYPASWFNAGKYDEPITEWMSKGIVKPLGPKMTLHQINNRLQEINNELNDLRFPGGSPNPIVLEGASRIKFTALKGERSTLIKDRDWYLSLESTQK